MKFLSALLSFVSLNALGAAGEIDYDRLSKRFVTSVKEAQVDAQFLQVPQVQACVAEHSITDVSNQAEIRAKQAAAANCLRESLSGSTGQLNDAQLAELSKKLELDAYGVVKGKSNQALVDYLSSRLEKALYGKGPDGQVVRLGEQKLVDQKVFVDIYETQLGKNILLEISNYCLNRLALTTQITPPATRLSTIAGMNPDELGRNITSGFTDINAEGPDITEEETIYDAIKTQLKSVTDSAERGETPADRLNKLFMNCVSAIPKMCEYYEDCLCQYRTRTKPQDFPDTPACNPAAVFKCSSPPPAPPTVGSHSCHVAARLRGYRTNLAATKEVQRSFDRNAGADARFRGLEGDAGKATYDKSNPGSGNSIDDVTAITTSEVNEALQVNQLSNEIEAIPENCVEAPEDAECARFYYQESEVRKFAQSSAGYSAATIVESEKIRRLTDKEQLKTYLRSRAYFDLEKLVDSGDMNQIVASARSRFEAEREATFATMTAAFERKQFTTELAGGPSAEDRAIAVRNEYKNKGKEFQQLILFNNVVSSYLSLRRAVPGSDETEDAGRNLKAFEREITSAGSENTALQYFQGISSDERSEITDSDTPLVDMNFLDQILRNEAPAATTPTNPEPE